jgi:hypothetical protein
LFGLVRRARVGQALGLPALCAGWGAVEVSGVIPEAAELVKAGLWLL